jgi:hypothetical protein
MHTYIGGPDTYIIGFLMVQKTNGTQSFVPLFEVGSLIDARVSVATLNGAGPIQSVTVLREFTEGAQPQIEVPIGISANVPDETTP